MKFTLAQVTTWIVQKSVLHPLHNRNLRNRAELVFTRCMNIEMAFIRGLDIET
jgi:hypothetical protein